jgi:predicted RND superfamily exporter protein
MRFALAAWIMRYRALVGIGFIVVTAGFMAGIPNVEIRTIFNDLLPVDDPYVQVYFDHRNFGNPLTMSIVIKRTDGDIYNADTLDKVWQMTRDIDLAPGINHDQIISIATEKLRYVAATALGIESEPLMAGHAPATDDEMREFRRRVESSTNAQTFYISNDETATLITASFQDWVEYGEAFDYAQGLVEAARDDHHEVHLAGQPVLTGWVYRLQKQTYFIFAITVGALIIALTFYMRNLAGILTPIMCATVAGLWGFGFIGWLARPIEPLLMIVPLLLVARSFSHCVQYTERYYEVLVQIGDRRKAAEVTMGIMMAPSVLGILTDVFGIAFIAIAPIKTMVNHAIFCGFWALWIIPTGVFMVSIILSYMPPPKNIDEIVGGGKNKSGIHRLQENALSFFASLAVGKRAKFTLLAATVLGVVALYMNTQIKIGNPVEGSNLLWDDSEFNTAVRAINAQFPGMNTLEIVVEAKERDLQHRTARTPEVVAVHSELQRLMAVDSVTPPRASLSFTDYMRATNRLFAGGNPKWFMLDRTPDAISAAGFAVTMGNAPINLAHVVDFTVHNSTVTFWYKDNTQETVDAALAAAQRAVDVVGIDHPEFRVRLGTGVIALQQAMNHVVERYHWFILFLLNCAVLIITALAYRSFVAALILLIPVNLSNLLLGAAMHSLGIGLDINAAIVAVMGVGIGIDYGIYLLSRICEEYSAHDQDLELAIYASLTTTGKAIMFTASVMLIGILPWYFLSDLKFMADMGMLLVAIMLINMMLSLIVLPMLVWFVRPAFLARTDLIIGENVDISQFTSQQTEKPLKRAPEGE